MLSIDVEGKHTLAFIRKRTLVTIIADTLMFKIYVFFKGIRSKTLKFALSATVRILFMKTSNVFTESAFSIKHFIALIAIRFQLFVHTIDMHLESGYCLSDIRTFVTGTVILFNPVLRSFVAS